MADLHRTQSFSKDWELVQKKTFTKWMNSHLRKVGTGIEDCQTEFQDGIKLMQLIKALYGLPIPKHNKNPKMRPHKLDNITLAFGMIEEAKIKTNFLKTHHLADCDLKMILGMIWAIILDFQIKGISVEDQSAKEGLLLWCQRKTKGYRDVKVENFHNSWKDGLALCALIHRHRPDLIDFDSLDKANKRENLELAFSVAEKELGIYRLLDIEDIVDVERPDEKSVMTYISEFFHKFSSQDQKETAARRIHKFTEFHLQVEQMQSNYIKNADEILNWIEEKIRVMEDRNFNDNTVESAQKLIEAHKQYKISEKPQWNAAKLDNEDLFNNTQIKLRSNNRRTWVAPSGKSLDDVDSAWARLAEAEKDRTKALRNNLIAAKDNLRKEFASQAQDFFDWISGIKKDIQEISGTLQEQLDLVNEKDKELAESDRIPKLEETNQRLEFAGIDDNPYTDFTVEELLVLHEQVKNALRKKKNFLENQLDLQLRPSIPPEKLAEFRETFKYFDKDNNQTLDKLEFKACLQALNQAFTDEEYEKVFASLAVGDKIEFDKFIDFMVKMTEDTDSPAQIKQSFKMLANDRNSITPYDLQVHPLQQIHIDYLTSHMPGKESSYDYNTYTDSCFSPPS